MLEGAIYDFRHFMAGTNPLHLAYTIPALFVIAYLFLGLSSACKSMWGDR